MASFAASLSPSSSGAVALDGFAYQQNVSVWAALDLLLAKQMAKHLVLEPATEEDLETDIDDEPGHLTQTIYLGAYHLVIQCKLRNTGPWKHGALNRVLAHGTVRVSPRERLRDPTIRYLLVTNADADGVARQIMVRDLGIWPAATETPPSIMTDLPADAPGRVAVLATMDFERLETRTTKMLTERFRVPVPSVGACQVALRQAAMDRMRGVGQGVWHRHEIEAEILSHGGSVGDSRGLEGFVPPTNWADMKAHLSRVHAIIISGPSGTGKTWAAKALIADLGTQLPGLSTVAVQGGPERVLSDLCPAPVVFEIEDPWGRFRLEPSSIPWNDQISAVLATASPDRKFVITSRSDVLAESRPKSLAQKWFVNLEEENYGPDERILLYERRLPGLPASLQAIVVNYRAEAIRALSTPMEMQRYFDTLREGMQENENANEYVQRCLREADQGTIEAALLNAVELRNEWPYAAALWGLFKSRAKLSFGLVPIIQAGLTERDPRLEDGLERYINFLIAGRNIRQNDSVLSYHHPRVELGLEQAIMKRPGQSGRILEYLIQILIDQDRLTPGDDWGREGAAHIVAAAGALEKFDLRLKQATRNTVDDWLRSRLLNGGARFEENLRVAANAASPESAPGELARWLTDVPSRRDWSFGVWSPEERPREWYAWLRADTATKPICEIFIRDVLRRSHHFYGRNFAVQIAKVADGLTSVFLEVAATMVRDGVNSNDYAIANGAVADLDGFDRIAVAAIAYQAELENHPDDETWLSLINGEYDAEAAEYYWESRGEDGYTADVFINTYVTALRRERGWRAISGHSQMTGLLYAWMHTIDEEKNASDDELRDLATAALNGPYEDRFWHLLCDQSYCDTGTQLHRRLLTGSADSGARFSAMELAVARYPSLLAQVAATLYDAGNLLRLFQMAVDLRAIARANGRHSERAAEGLTAIVSVLSAPPAAVARALFDPKQTIPLDQPALALLRSVDLTADAQLAMACAEAAGEAGSFNIGYLREILADSQNDDAQLDLSVRAIKLAISAQNWSIVEESLQHRFADVREHALVALAEQTTDVLPARLLALANDKGHGVRQALLKILAQRRRTEHIDTLIILAGDDWADRGSYYGQDPDHPIAVAAAELLAEPPKLNKTQVDSIARRVSTSEDSNASRRLLVALICNGEPDTPDRVMTLALKTGRPPLHQYAAEALLLTREFLDTSVANRITADQLIRRPASIACALASTLGAAAEISHLVEVSKAVASVPQRRALAFVIWLEARERDSVAENTIRNLLPPEFATAMAAAANGGRRLRRESLDQLADIRVAEAIRTMWPNLFKERPK